MNGMSTGYLFCYAITASISGANTFAINLPNVTRYARNPRSSTLAQAIAMPVLLTLITLAASSQVIYGQVYWNPLEIVQLWDDRAGKFFAGLLYVNPCFIQSLTLNLT
ncbi:MAG: hypothetical protein Q9181_006656 [Wetmoreana brouardii]